jgi:hypothetical protein
MKSSLAIFEKDLSPTCSGPHDMIFDGHTDGVGTEFARDSLGSCPTGRKGSCRPENGNISPH